MLLLIWLKSTALVALIVFLGFGSYLCFETAQAEKQIAAQTQATFTATNAAITNINSATVQLSSAITNLSANITQTELDVRGVTTSFQGVAIGLQKTVALVNAPCVPGPCGTIFDLSKTLNTTRLTLGQVEIAANNFDKNEGRFYSQEDQLYADGDASIKQFDALLASPDLTTALHGGAVTATNFGLMTTDAQTKFHDFLYPPPCKGWKCHIKTVYETVRVGSQFAEPAYWGWQLFSGAKP